MAKNITKKQFDAATNNHLPNNWIKFTYKYFSSETEKKDMKLNNTIIFTLLSLFVVGFVSTILKLPKRIIIITALIYSILLAILVLYLLSAVILNNNRINKICKELGITKEEYNGFVIKFYS